MTLTAKFGLFRKKLPEAMPTMQAQFAQVCYLAGAQAVFQILSDAAGMSAEEARAVSSALQLEIQVANAMTVRAQPESRIVLPS